MDIIVTRTRTPISWWIRWRAYSPWSHVCVAGEHDVIFTTAWNGFDAKDAADYLKGKSFAIYRFVSPDLTPEQLKAGLFFNRQMLGAPYSYKDILSLWLDSFRGHGTEGLKDASDKMFCSEAVANAYRAMGIVLAPQLKKDPHMMLPGDCIEDIRLEKVFEKSS